ncbi:MAG: GNAT family protein [Acidobacteriota bacterium]
MVPVNHKFDAYQMMPAMFSYEIDEDTKLSLFELRHAEKLNALITQNYEHIREWSAWLKDKERQIENTQEFIERNLKRFAGNDGFGICIWYKGEMAGQIEYNYLDWNNRKTELGFWLGESFQGKGLVTKSCCVLINHAFDELQLNRVEIRCGVENRKSRKIAEKLGFTEEGIIRQSGWLHDHFVDYVIYGMLSSDWKDKNQSK